MKKSTTDKIVGIYAYNKLNYIINWINHSEQNKVIYFIQKLKKNIQNFVSMKEFSL
jgi:hypothetical protein